VQVAFEALPFPAVLVVEQRLEAGTAWLIELLSDPRLGWSTKDRAPLSPGQPPWLLGAAWSGPLRVEGDGLVRWFQVAGIPLGAAWLWQFAELEAGHEQHRLIAAAVEAMPESFAITTAQLELPGPQFVYCNRAFTELTGWQERDLRGRTPRILQGPRTERDVLDRLRGCLSRGEVFVGGTINYHHTGKAFWNDWNIAPVAFHERTTHYVSVMRDTTAYRISSHQIGRAASEWTELVDVLDNAIVMTDLEGRVVRCNRAFAKLVRRTFPELIGIKLAPLLFGEAQDLPQALFRSDPSSLQLAPVPGWFSVRGWPVSRDRAIHAWVHTFQNVTLFHDATTQLERLALAASQAHDGIAVLDADAAIDYANLGFRVMFSLPEAPAPMPPLPGISSEVGEALALALRDGTVTIREVRARADGTRAPLEIRIVRLVGVRLEHTGYLVIARDQSERDRLVQIAEHASTMENVGHWLGGLRHELGNPVNSVKMALTVLRTHLSEFGLEEIARYVERASAELARVEYLLRSLKTFSLYDSMELTPLELGGFLASVSRLIEPDLGRRGIALEVHVERELTALADSRGLHQALVNLVSNAVDAAPTVVTVRAMRREGQIELVVQDDGCGIPAARVARLFQPFETTKPTGTGLGLVLVRRLVTAMRGTVEVASEPGRGTAATILLVAAPRSG
jgi:PAS domain S-box-containing protein